jgi:hypothetical protein
MVYKTKYEYDEKTQKGDNRFPMTHDALDTIEIYVDENIERKKRGEAMEVIQVMPIMLLNEEDKTRYLHLLGKNYLCYLGYYDKNNGNSETETSF